jgi:cobalt-zinc-cadmium efflux system membrane fusion protein
MKRTFIIIAMLCGILIIACNNKPIENISAEIPKEELVTFVELTKEQFEAVDIKLGNIEMQNIKTSIKASGHLEVPPQNKAEVSTFIGAVIKSISVLEGSKVTKGQTLAILEHPDFIKLQEEYITVKSNFSFLEKEYQRQKELAEQNAGTGKVFQKAEADYYSGKAKLNSLESQLKILSVNLTELSKGNIASSMVLTAPISGYIGHINAHTGAYAEPNKMLFEIIDNSQIHCDLLVYEKDIFKVKVGQKIHFIITNMPEHQKEHGSESIEGEIFGINKSFENNSKAISVHALIRNENHELIPGMYVSALIDVGENKATVVPSEAVFTTDGKEFVFIRNKFTACKKHKNCAGHEFCAPSENCPEHPECEQHEHSPLKEPCTKHKECEEHEKCKAVENNEAFYFTMKEVRKGTSDLGYTEVAFIDEVPNDAIVVTKGAFYLLSKSKTSGQMDACGH